MYVKRLKITDTATTLIAMLPEHALSKRVATAVCLSVGCDSSVQHAITANAFDPVMFELLEQWGGGLFA